MPAQNDARHFDGDASQDHLSCMTEEALGSEDENGKQSSEPGTDCENQRVGKRDSDRADALPEQNCTEAGCRRNRDGVSGCIREDGSTLRRDSRDDHRRHHQT